MSAKQIAMDIKEEVNKLLMSASSIEQIDERIKKISSMPADTLTQVNLGTTCIKVNPETAISMLKAARSTEGEYLALLQSRCELALAIIKGEKDWGVFKS
jgi:hypothetical protein